MFKSEILKYQKSFNNRREKRERKRVRETDGPTDKKMSVLVTENNCTCYKRNFYRTIKQQRLEIQ